jgi:hypothetical protein
VVEHLTRSRSVRNIVCSTAIMRSYGEPVRAASLRNIDIKDLRPTYGSGRLADNAKELIQSML